MPAPSESRRDSPHRRQRRRRTHQRIDSEGEPLTSDRRRSHNETSRDRYRERHDDFEDGYRRRRREESPGTPSKQRPKRRSESQAHQPGSRSDRTRTTSTGLSMERLAQLDNLNHKLGWESYDRPRPQPEIRRAETERRRRPEYEDEGESERERRREERRRRRKEERRKAELAEAAAAAGAGITAYTVAHDEDEDAEEPIYRKSRPYRRDSRRIASGQKLEQGDDAVDDREHRYNEKESFWTKIRNRYGSDGGSGSSNLDPEAEERKTKMKKRIMIGVGVLLLILIIVIPVAVVVSKKHNNSSGSGGGSGNSNSTPDNSNLNGISESDIPKQYQGTYLDPFTWYDTSGFNVTFTSEMVGGLSVMGLYDSWDDSKQANSQVPALNQEWKYGEMMIRGINLGGWLSIEPFITPSLFQQFSAHDAVIDEYTLTSTLGPSKAASTLEQHYSSWVSEKTFSDIQAAGFDHVRIPFSYWAVKTFDGDPYVPNTSWRYLLRSIEWARKYGLRVNLDLHGVPGSQNGWNHSGRQGPIGWLNGTDGDLNGQRTIDIHDQLSQFFTQPRYKNVITMYGLVNEPRMVELNTQAVLTWSTNAINKIRSNNFTGVIVFGDGFMGLDNWQGKLQGINNILLDVHQYVIFNVDQIVLNHHDKINFACGGWTAQALRSENTATGFGPTLCGEWSQADTDCAQYLNNVGVGSRWEGTLNMASGLGGSTGGSVLTPTCPTKNNPRCSCDNANANVSSYSDEYKQWLLMFAEAQMHSFEQGWGWFYWTWKTETAPQWSYSDGLAAGILPKLAYQRDFNCSSDIPDFASLGLPEYY